MQEDEEKAEVLNRLDRMLQENEISRAQVLKLLRNTEEKENAEVSGEKKDHDQGFASKGTLLRLLALGICLIAAGLLWWQWLEMSRLARVVCTLGSGLMLFLTAFITDRISDRDSLIEWLYILSGIVLPVGLVVTYSVYGVSIGSPLILTQIAGILFALYGAVFLFSRRTVLLAFGIIFGIGVFFGLTNTIGFIFLTDLTRTFYLYRGFVVSVLLIGIGFYVSESERESLRIFLFCSGSLGLLLSGILLTFDNSAFSFYWGIIYPFLVMFVLTLGVWIHNKFCLITGSVFLMAFLAGFSLQHFKPELGLPVTVILLGFGIISIASVTYLLYSNLNSALTN